MKRPQTTAAPLSMLFLNEGAIDYVHIFCRSYLDRTISTMADQLPLARQWILLRKICSHHYGLTVKDMVHELNVGEKTIRRDLETFPTAGIPLKEVVGEFGRKTWHIEPGKTEPGLHFTFDEAIALYLVGPSLQHEEVRHWKLNCIEAAEVTQIPFQRPDDSEVLMGLRCLDQLPPSQTGQRSAPSPRCEA